MLEVELVQFDEHRETARHRVRGKKFLIGRHKMCHLQLADETVSKTHCVIIKHRNQVLITDLGSRAGTKVNGNVVCLAETAPLQHEDKIQLGDHEFVLSVIDAATGKPGYCDAKYVGQLPYPFVCLPNRRGMEELHAAKNGQVKAKEIEDDEDDESLNPEISLTYNDLPLQTESAATQSSVNDNGVADQREAEEREKEASRKRIEAARQRILASQQSSSAASDALQRMFPGKGK